MTRKLKHLMCALALAPAIALAADSNAPVITAGPVGGFTPDNPHPSIVVFSRNVTTVAGSINLYVLDNASQGKWSLFSSTPIAAGQTTVLSSPTATTLRYDFYDQTSHLSYQGDPITFPRPSGVLTVGTIYPVPNNGTMGCSVSGPAIDPDVTQLSLELWTGKTLVGSWKLMLNAPGMAIDTGAPLPVPTNLDLTHKWYVMKVWSQKWTTPTTLTSVAYGASQFGTLNPPPN
jgi:hypothetical protein